MGLLLLGALGAALVALGVQQASFDPAFYAPPAPPPVDLGDPGASAFAGPRVPGWRALGPLESFTPATLFQKIDGAADLYLSAGFTGLACQRYASDDGAHAFQACLYRMTDADAAWSVYSRQRRGDARPVALATTAYRTANALFLAHGPVYLEVVGADASDATGAAIEALASAWMQGQAPAGAARKGPPFPAAGLDPDSVRLLRDSVFGFSRLDDVTIGGYTLDGAAASAFWSERASPEEAATLAGAYVAFLLANGATRGAADAGVPGATVLDVLGTTEIVASAGNVLLGVHEADTPAAAHTLFQALTAVAPRPSEVTP